MAPHTPRLSRRTLFATGGSLGAGALLAACGDGATGAGDGSWSFTDDRGEKATADATPDKVVAYIAVAAAFRDLGIADKVVGVFGPTELKNGDPDPQAGELDIGKVTIIGNTWGEFNIEEYAKLQPQLLVSNMFEPEVLWYVPEDSADKIYQLAPSVGITTYDLPLTDALDRFAELAQALGADLESEPVTAAKTRFDEASKALSAAAEASGGVKVLAAAATADMLYVGDPRPYVDLAYYRQLGVDFVVPDEVDDDGYFQSLSWENADQYPADLIMLDVRTGNLQAKDLESNPAWLKLPAAEAGQTTSWLNEPRYSYAGCAPLLEDLTEAIGNTKKII